MQITIYLLMMLDGEEKFHCSSTKEQSLMSPMILQYTHQKNNQQANAFDIGDDE